MDRAKDITQCGEALRLKSNGVQVLENERLHNGLCRLRLQRYGKAPEIPAGVPLTADCQVIRWADEELPIYFLYVVWMEAQDA